MSGLLDRMLRGGYERTRGRPLPDELPVDVLREVGARRAREAARGEFARRRYRDSGSMHFRGRGVQVRSPRYLSIGRTVVFGDDVLIDAFSVDGIVLGDRVTVARGAALLGSGVIREPGVGVWVGEHAAIGANNIIWGQGGVRIGANCLLGPNVTMVSENHGANRDALVREQPPERAPIDLGPDCWIGNNVTITAGVTLGEGCVVGAGAVVTKSAPPYSIIVGVPGRVVGERT